MYYLLNNNNFNIDIHQEEVEKLFEEGGGNIEGIYPLSPKQLLFISNSLIYSKLKRNVQVYSLILKTKLDTAVFKVAWNFIIREHSLLRTGFKWKKLSAPLQVVYHKVDLEFTEDDWCAYSIVEQENKLNEYIQNEFSKGFKINKPPLMRMCIVKVGEDKFHFIWIFHNSLFDGWSMNIIFNELVDIYYSLLNNNEILVGFHHPYSNYIKWLYNKTEKDAKQFWKKELENFIINEPVDNGQGLVGMDVVQAEHEIDFSSEEILNMKTFSEKSSLSLHTVMFACWSFLISQKEGKTDFLVANLVSGRPEDVDEIESIVGPFSSSLPVRVKICMEASVMQWLKELQDKMNNISNYSFVTVQQISQWCNIPLGVIQGAINENTVNYLDFPTNVHLDQKHSDMNIEINLNIRLIDVSKRVFIRPKHNFEIAIFYNKLVNQEEEVKKMLVSMKKLVNGICNNKFEALKDIKILAE